MRGEDHPHARARGMSVGRSPRAWGRLTGQNDDANEIGTIPTCVGKTRIRMHDMRTVKDDPHVRGEDSKSLPALSFHRGRSPRAWGRRTAKHACLLRMGTIPTCVGKTIERRPPARGLWDDPHVRGEDCNTTYKLYKAGGRSPRAWGRRSSAALRGMCMGTIPTCVGKTVSAHNACAGMRDDPHVRGEDTSMYRPGKFSMGRSPRAWGRRARRLIGNTKIGTIPTCVGKTWG